MPMSIALVLATGLSGWIAAAAFAGRMRGFGVRLALGALAGTLSFVGLFAAVFLLACAVTGSIGTRDTRITGVLYDFVLPSLLATAPLALVQLLLLSTRYPEPQRWRLSLLVLLAWGAGAVDFWTLFWWTT
jgi:hypothetical protein